MFRMGFIEQKRGGGRGKLREISWALERAVKESIEKQREVAGVEEREMRKIERAVREWVDLGWNRESWNWAKISWLVFGKEGERKDK